MVEPREALLALLASARQRALASLQASKRRDYWVELGPVASFVEVAQLEDAFAPLPEPLLWFLLTVGTGIAPSGYNGLGPLGLSSSRADPKRPFPFTETVADAVVADARARGDGHPLDGTLAVASEGCGTYSFIVVTGPAEGSVWTDLSCVDDGLVRVADDFLTYYLQALGVEERS